MIKVISEPKKKKNTPLLYILHFHHVHTLKEIIIICLSTKFIILLCEYKIQTSYLHNRFESHQQNTYIYVYIRIYIHK